MGDYAFIEETSNYARLKFFFTLFFIILFLSASVLLAVQYGLADNAVVRAAQEATEKDIKNATPLGLLYLSFISEIFFLPIPLELFFFASLVKGNYFLLSFLFVIAGIILTHALNYYVGSHFSRYALYLLPKKKLYKARRWIDNYGAYAIFIFYTLPLPAQIVALGLGIARYNFKRFFIFFVTGASIKYLAIAGFYYLLN